MGDAPCAPDKYHGNAEGASVAITDCPDARELPGSMLSAANRLCFGVNAAHLFVQFYIEAHVSVDARVFTAFAWLTQLFGISALSVVTAIVAFVLVQRPWAMVFGAGIDCASAYCQQLLT